VGEADGIAVGGLVGFISAYDGHNVGDTLGSTEGTNVGNIDGEPAE